MKLIDPHISEKEIQRYVDWVFELDKISMTSNKDVLPLKQNSNFCLKKQRKHRDFEEIILRLECCACFMH